MTQNQSSDTSNSFLHEEIITGYDYEGEPIVTTRLEMVKPYWETLKGAEARIKAGEDSQEIAQEIMWHIIDISALPSEEIKEAMKELDSLDKAEAKRRRKHERNLKLVSSSNANLLAVGG